MIENSASSAEHSTKRDEGSEALGNTHVFPRHPPLLTTTAANSPFFFGHLAVEGLAAWTRSQARLALPQGCLQL